MRANPFKKLKKAVCWTQPIALMDKELPNCVEVIINKKMVSALRLIETQAEKRIKQADKGWGNEVDIKDELKGQRDLAKKIREAIE